MKFVLFLSSSVLQAQAVALTVAQAFTVAFELWQVAKEGMNHPCHPSSSGNDTHTLSHINTIYGGVFFFFLSVSSTTVCTDSALMHQGHGYLLLNGS